MTVLLLSVLLISLRPVACTNFEVDLMDADYIYGMPDMMSKGKWTDRYLFVRKVIAKAFEHMTVSTSATQSAATILLNSLVAPKTGRSIADRVISSKSVYFYIEPYVKEGENMLFSSVGLMNNSYGRTTTAVLSINLAMVDTNTNNLWYYFPLVIREILKVMSMDKSNWIRYYDAARSPNPKLLNETINNGTLAGSSRYYFNHSATNAALYALHSNATDYFKGIVLEDQGDVNQMHNGWEQALFPNDVLSSMPVQPVALSRFSFVALAASGWYTASTGSYYTNSHHGAGTNSGDFLKTKCLPTDSHGSCSSEGAKSCSWDGETKTICAKGDLSNDCMFQKATDVCFLNNTGSGAASIEKFGRKSRCVMGSISGGANQPLCLQVDSFTAASTTVTFKDSTGATYACTGSDVTVGSVTIRCPVTNTLTNMLNTACTNDCNGNGMCLYSDSSSLASRSGATCSCFWGFGGSECATRVIREETFKVRNPYWVGNVGFRKNYSLIASFGSFLVGLAALLAFN